MPAPGVLPARGGLEGASTHGWDEGPRPPPHLSPLSCEPGLVLRHPDPAPSQLYLAARALIRVTHLFTRAGFLRPEGGVSPATAAVPVGPALTQLRRAGTAARPRPPAWEGNVPTVPSSGPRDPGTGMQQVLEGGWRRAGCPPAASLGVPCSPGRPYPRGCSRMQPVGSCTLGISRPDALSSVCHCAAQSCDQPGSLGWHVPGHRPAEAWELREGMRRPPLLLFMLCRGGQSLSLAPASPSSSEALAASEPTGDAEASSISRRPARLGRAGGRAMLRAGGFPATTLALLGCRPCPSIPWCGAKTVTAKAREEGDGWSRRRSPWSWPWQGEPAGAGVAPLRAEPSSAAGCCARMTLGCATPPTVLVRGAAARRGCGHGGAKGGFTPICHHPGPAAAAVSVSRKELDPPRPSPGLRHGKP